MTTSNRILVVIDPTAGTDQACVQRAAWLAEVFDAQLDLLVCHYDQYLSGEPFFDSPGLARSRRDAVHNRRVFLDKIAEPLRAKGRKVTSSAVWDTPLDEGIVRHVLRTNPKLVVKETHYHGAISRALFTNTDWGLIRKCPVPLWLVKPLEWNAAPIIMAAVDPLHEHDKPAALDGDILSMSSTLQEKTGGQLHVFHGYLSAAVQLASATELLSEPLAEMDKTIEAGHREALDKLLTEHNLTPSDVHCLAGDTARLLPELAEELQANLVVMGAVARTPVQRMFLGSTAEKVMDKIHSDLLVVKPDWFETSVKPGEPEIVEGTS